MPARKSLWRPTGRFSNHSLRDESAIVKSVRNGAPAEFTAIEASASAINEALEPDETPSVQRA